jgi:polysaccharide pyruvyl transferase WcaK-like protein
MELLAAMTAIEATVVSTRFYGLVLGLVAGKHVVNIGEAKRNLALMREADLRGFSLTAERLTAQRLVTLISKHADPAVQARITATRNASRDTARATLAAFAAAYANPL